MLEPPEERRLKKTPKIVTKNVCDCMVLLLLQAWMATRTYPESLTPPGYHRAEDGADFGNLPQNPHPAAKHKHSSDLSAELWGAEPARKGPCMGRATIYPATIILGSHTHCKYGYGPGHYSTETHHYPVHSHPSSKLLFNEQIKTRLFT